jgi:hypothetical protein
MSYTGMKALFVRVIPDIGSRARDKGHEQSRILPGATTGH